MEDARILEEAKNVVSLLACSFSVSIPNVKIKTRGNCDVYNRFEKTISLIRNRSYFSVEHATLHEFSHHLVNEKYKYRPKRHHGKEFKSALLTVIKTWYGKEKTDCYPWHKEYKSIQKLKPQREL